MIGPRHIRFRITLWHTLIFGLILILYVSGTILYLWAHFDRQIASSLKEELEVVQHFATSLPLGDQFADLHSHDFDRYERGIEVWSADGHLVLRSRVLEGISLGPPPQRLGPVGEYPQQRFTLGDGSRWRMVRTTHTIAAERYEVRLAISEEPYFAEIRMMGTVLFAGIPIALVLAIGTGTWFARRTLRPIEAMAATAARIGADSLSERIPVVNPQDEFGHLAGTLNTLLDRLQNAFDQLRRFTANLSTANSVTSS